MSFLLALFIINSTAKSVIIFNLNMKPVQEAATSFEHRNSDKNLLKILPLKGWGIEVENPAEKIGTGSTNASK